MSSYMLSYEAAFEAGPSQVGGKGWNLARLARYGFNVPRGGVLSAGVYARLIAQLHIAEQVAKLPSYSAFDAGTADTAAALDQVASTIRRQILPADVTAEIARFLEQHKLSDKPLAVRSSATSEDGAETSFAGIHESTLNVVGLDAVCQSVLDCYASLWSPQALAYRRRMNVSDCDAACAVVLCEMVVGPHGSPVAAGVAFSCHPLSGRRDVITINGAAGLGDAVVRGDVTPDEYVLDAHDPAQIESRVEHGPSLLTDPQLATLGRLVWRVHWALGDGQDPQDIEWAFDGERFWLLQSRPVTSLPHYTFPAIAREPAIWSNANIKDSLPGPVTIVTWSMIESLVRDVLFASLKMVDYPLPPGLQVMRRFDGRLYFDLAIVQWAMYDAIGITPAETNRTTGGFQPEIHVPEGNPMRGWEGLRRSWRRVKTLRGLARLRRQLPNSIERVFQENRRAQHMDLRGLTDAGLRREFQHRLSIGNGFNPKVQLAAAYYGAWMTLLQDLFGRLTGDRQQSLVTRLLAAAGSVPSAEHGYRLIDLAVLARAEPAAQAALKSGDARRWESLDASSPFRQALLNYLHDFGHRAVCEMDFSSVRWRNDPTYLLDQIVGLLDLPAQADPRTRAAEIRRDAETELRQLPWLARPPAGWMLSKARLGASLRENSKSAAAACVDLLQGALLEVGRRLADRGHLRSPSDVFHLSIADVDSFLTGQWSGTGAAHLAADRAQGILAWMELSPPEVIVEGKAATQDRVRYSVKSVTVPEGSTCWQGVAAAPGVAEGRACVLQSAHQGNLLAAGDVLVAPSTDPGWTPLFLRASAVVMETGGYLSHGAIVAREFGIPSVVNLPGILSRVESGNRLRVDGDRGEVFLVESSQALAGNSKSPAPAHS